MTTPPEARDETAVAERQTSPGAQLVPPGDAPPDIRGVVWQAPSYDFSRKAITVSAVSSDSTRRDHGVLRTARWCMDGSAFLTTSEDRSVRLYLTPDTVGSSSTPRLDPYLTLPQAAPVLSSLWYPTAAPSAPEGFCFAAAIRDAPVRLIDGTTGHIRATYPIVDHRERFIAPYSMAWNPSATKLYCGHENAIEVLDISAPGYDTSERINTSLTKGDKSGQKALSFSTDFSGLYAAGSFGGSVSLYSEDDSGAVGHLDGVEGGGVTQLAFHPSSPNHLFVASRRSCKLQVFDLRNPSEPFHAFPRSAATNQRMAFDLDPWGRWVAIGDEHGSVGIWDVAGGGKWGERLWEGQVADEQGMFGGPRRDTVLIAADAISSVQFHPLKPSLLVASGSRHVDLHVGMSDGESDSGSEDSSEDEDEGEDEARDREGDQEEAGHGLLVQAPRHAKIRAGLGILSFGP